MKPPPSRYRVIERGGRLVTIDTWDKSGSAGRAADQPVARGGARPVAPGESGMANRLADLLVGLVCMGTRDEQGRHVLATASFYDAKAPRDIVLGDAATRQVGNVLIGAFVALLIVAVILWSLPVLLVLAIPALAVSGGVINTSGRPAITRWLDRLEETGAA